MEKNSSSARSALRHQGESSHVSISNWLTFTATCRRARSDHWPRRAARAHAPGTQARESGGPCALGEYHCQRHPDFGFRWLELRLHDRADQFQRQRRGHRHFLVCVVPKRRPASDTPGLSHRTCRLGRFHHTFDLRRRRRVRHSVHSQQLDVLRSARYVDEFRVQECRHSCVGQWYFGRLSIDQSRDILRLSTGAGK